MRHKREDWVFGVVCLAAGAYAVHGLMTGTGLVGWLYYLQQSLMGFYSFKLTVVILALGVLMIGWLAALAVARFSAAGDDDELAPSPSSRAPAKPLTTRGSLLLGLGGAVITWVIGGGIYLWHTAQQRDDATARYESMVLSESASAPKPSGSHVNLQGVLLLDRAVTARKGSDKGRVEYHLIPAVAPDWLPGQPVAYVVKVGAISELPGKRLRLPPHRRPGEPAPPPDALLARLDGAVSVPAVQEFRKIGVVLLPDSQLLRVVPSHGDQPALRENSAGKLDVLLMVCGVTSGSIALYFGGLAVALAIRRRRLEGQHLQRPT